MAINNETGFINNKIVTLGTALFSNFSKAILKFPVSLIKTGSINSGGDILFSVKRVYENMDGFDKKFPAHLHFYNKNSNYYIEADGEAYTTIEKQNILIRFSIVNIQYFYLTPKKSNGLGTAILNFFNHLYNEQLFKFFQYVNFRLKAYTLNY